MFDSLGAANSFKCLVETPLNSLLNRLVEEEWQKGYGGQAKLIMKSQFTVGYKQKMDVLLLVRKS